MRKRIVWLVIITLVLAAALFYLFINFSLLPGSASSQMSSLSGVLKLLFAIGSIILVIIVTTFTFSMIFYRRQKGDTSDGAYIPGQSVLENAWTYIPLGLVLGLGIYGGFVLLKMTELPPPQSQLTVNVTAFRFGWQFSYPDSGVQSFELHLPVNGNVVLSMESKDVIHSFWIPELGPKQDIVPGLTTELVLNPTKTGEYSVF